METASAIAREKKRQCLREDGVVEEYKSLRKVLWLDQNLYMLMIMERYDGFYITQDP